MKFMQNVFYHTLIAFNYVISIDNLIIIIYPVLKLWEIWEFFEFRTVFDDVISGHNDIIGCWFFTAWKVLGLGLIILKVWGYLTYRYYVTFSESDPSFRFSQMKKSRKMNLFDRSNPCFRVNRYRWIRWWYQIFDILNFGTFRFLKLKGPIIDYFCEVKVLSLKI